MSIKNKYVINPEIMKWSITVLLAFMVNFANGQIFKNIGLKTGVTSTFYQWRYRPNSTSPYEIKMQSDSDIGLAFMLTSDVADHKYWGVNVSLGWLQKNAKVQSFFYLQSQIQNQEDQYKTGYLSFNPTFKGKLPLGRSISLYGNVGLNLDVMLSHSLNVESYTYNYFYTLQKPDELKHVSYGFTFGPGIEKSFTKMTLRAEYMLFASLSEIIDAKGPRLDAQGDEGFYFKLNSFVSAYTFSMLFKL